MPPFELTPSRQSRLSVKLVLTLVGLWAGTSGLISHADGLTLLSPELRAAESLYEQSQLKFDQLGPLRLRQTAPQVGAQLLMSVSPPPQAPWVQLDLGKKQSFDQIMIVPVVIGVAEEEQEPYAFPKRFRVDVSANEDFQDFVLICDSGVPGASSKPQRLDTTSPYPVVIDAPGTRARYIRVTVTGLNKATDRWTFALSEIMLIHGDQNVALGASVTMPHSSSLAPVWDPTYLVDGRTPLGPPIIPASVDEDLPRFDGVFCVSANKDAEQWFQVDLGASQTVDAMRLFPVHARQGADYPGYGFPLRFRVEGSDDPSFEEGTVLYRTEDEFPNPGNNPVFVPLTTDTGSETKPFQHYRLVSEMGARRTTNKVGFAEIQLLKDGKNLAVGKPMIAKDVMSERPLGLLVDGDASYGRIVTLSDWAERWKTARTLRRDSAIAASRIERYRELAFRRAIWLAAAVVTLACLVVTWMAWRSSRERRRQRAEFRMRLAQDLHDEIGSNLAAISRIGEVGEAIQVDPESQEDWRSVRALAGECTEAMQETLWLLGGPRRSDQTLPTQLKAIADRMLTGVEVSYDIDGSFEDSQPDEATLREVVLVFKAMFANIARSSQATQVHVLAKKDRQQSWIQVKDNGVGFDTDAWESRMVSRGMGLESMTSRMSKIGGKLTIDSEPGKGTRLTMVLP
ncbi:discoidin domain-containing protein [Neorhodopirellula lusitana]|uniref:discoidin domain-containing protein n=1 Tax=Neorhodopirellula lusitana TaxID=445327 RepID=UPI00384DC1C3